jgi:hypothetical protein
LPGSEVPEAANRVEAIAVARRATAAYLSGNVEGLKQVASEASAQLVRCTNPEAWRRTWEVEAGSVEIRGNERLAVARVETAFRSESLIGADPVLVVLRREGTRWSAIAVSMDVLSIKEAHALCRLALGGRDSGVDPLAPRLIYPADGGTIAEMDKSFAWEVFPGGGPLTAQVCQVLLNPAKDAHWPETRLKVYSGEPRGRSLLWSETALDLTGLDAEQMSWCVWSIGKDGRIGVSEVRSYRKRRLKY